MNLDGGHVITCENTSLLQDMLTWGDVRILQ